MGCVRRRGRSWNAQVRVAGWQSFTKSFNKKSDAVRWVQELEQTLKNSPLPRVNANDVSLLHLLQRYGLEVSSQLKGSEKELYKLNLYARHPIAQNRLSNLTPLHFEHLRDELVVTRVDRLARSVFDLQDIVKTLDGKGVTLSATEQPISTKDATSKCFLDMLSVFAEFETNLRKERQMEGIAKAKEKGVYKGRKPSVNVQKVKELRDGGMGASAIAKELGIGRASVYRALEG